jgi:cytochrome c-type biogenesis protein CcmH
MTAWFFMLGILSLLLLALVLVFYPLRHTIRGAKRYAFALLILIIVAFAYVQWGQVFDLIDVWQQQKKQVQVQAMLASVDADPQKLIKKLERHMEQTPGDPKGWYLLGRLYASQGEWSKAHDAYAKAHHLNPSDEKIGLNEVQSLWELNHQQLNDEARRLLLVILEKNPQQLDALSMLAMDAYLRHAYPQAIDYWEAMLGLIPPDSNDAALIRKAIAKADEAQRQAQGDEHERKSISSD